MVKEWIDEDKAMHCITDSVSHTRKMMGGLVGFRPGYINDILKLNINPEAAWEKLLSLAPEINYSIKDSDQKFMEQVMYPKLCTSATEHFIKGQPHNLVEGNGRHYTIDEKIDIGVPDLFKMTNLFAGHAGAAGFYEIPTLRFLSHYDPYAADYDELESMPEYSQVFYWRTREDLILSGFKK
jgi:hypothetical protein